MSISFILSYYKYFSKFLNNSVRLFEHDLGDFSMKWKHERMVPAKTKFTYKVTDKIMKGEVRKRMHNEKYLWRSIVDRGAKFIRHTLWGWLKREQLMAEDFGCSTQDISQMTLNGERMKWWGGIHKSYQNERLWTNKFPSWRHKNMNVEN